MLVRCGRRYGICLSESVTDGTNEEGENPRHAKLSYGDLMLGYVA